MQDDFSLEAYDYTLPQKNIAQYPADRRDQSKLLVYNRATSAIEHRLFADVVDYFAAGDIMVVNNTRVFPARLLGKKETGGKAEVFLLELPAPPQQPHPSFPRVQSVSTGLIKSSKRPSPGSLITVSDTLNCRVLDYLEDGKVRIGLEHSAALDTAEELQRYGCVPLPPYIERTDGSTAEDRTRYQTIYAEHAGAVAAPTAGLHFTEEVLKNLEERGVETVPLTLHVGYGTFSPVRVENITEHKIHSEYLSLSQDTVTRISRAKENGGRVWAVGTTSVRGLEYCCQPDGMLRPHDGWCDVYITPGFRFSVVDNLITNFHLPKSSLLFLVSALCGREKLLQCYREAIAHGYRFYSYGDAMAVI